MRPCCPTNQEKVNGGPEGKSCVYLQTRLGAPLMQALQRLLAVLLSSAGGQELVFHNPVAMGALLKALDPEADPYGPVFASESQPTRSDLLQLCLMRLVSEHDDSHTTAGQAFLKE